MLNLDLARLWPNRKGVELDVPLPAGQEGGLAIRRVQFGTPPDQDKPILEVVTNLSPDGQAWPLHEDATIGEVQQLLAAVARSPETSFFASDIRLHLKKLFGM